MESTMNCRDCKNFIPPIGPECYGWGDCKLIGRNVHSEGACVAFKDKEDTQITPVKIEIVKRKSVIDETKVGFMVHVYDNKGELIDASGFKAENLAGRYAFEMEQYYKFLKED